MKYKSSQVRSVDSAKEYKLNKSYTTQEHIYKYNKKRRDIKSKMCNRIKSAKQIRCAKQYTGLNKCTFIMSNIIYMNFKHHYSSF